MDKNTEEFYVRLKTKLEETTTWPAEYLFKFIIPTDEDKKQQLSAIFDGLGAVINTKLSAKGNYFSFSINLMMDSPQAVIDKYLEVSTIEGVISL